MANSATPRRDHIPALSVLGPGACEADVSRIPSRADCGTNDRARRLIGHFSPVETGSSMSRKRTLSKRRVERRSAAQAPALSGVSFDPRVYRAVAERPLGRSGAIPGEIQIVLALARVHGVFGFGSKAAYSHALERAVREEDDTRRLRRARKGLRQADPRDNGVALRGSSPATRSRRWSASAMATRGSGAGALRTGASFWRRRSCTWSRLMNTCCA